MSAGEKKIQLTPEKAYQLVVAALDVVGGVSPAVHRRIRRAHETGEATSFVTVRWWDLVKLVDVLNEVPPGGMADQVIAEEDQRRRARKT